MLSGAGGFSFGARMDEQAIHLRKDGQPDGRYIQPGKSLGPGAGKMASPCAPNGTKHLSDDERPRKNWKPGTLARPCSIQEETFAQKYALTGVLGRSVLEAGYLQRTKDLAGASSVGTGLLKRPWVAARVREIQKAKMEELDLSDTKVLKEYCNVGFANMLDYTQPTEDGQDLVPDFSRMTREQASAIQEVTIEQYIEGRGGNAQQVKRTKIKLYNKTEALQDLAKHLNLFKEHQREGVEAFLAFLASRNDIVENMTDIKTVESKVVEALPEPVSVEGNAQPQS